MDRNEPQNWDHRMRAYVESGKYHQALETLVRGYQHMVVGFCSRVLGGADWAEDVAQEVFLVAHQSLARFRWESSVRTWLFSIARKQCLKTLRDSKRRTELMKEKGEGASAEFHRVPAPDEGDPEIWFQVREGLMRLKEDERALLVMRYYNGLLLAEIAGVLGTLEANVRRRLAKALRHLRGEMNNETG